MKNISISSRGFVAGALVGLVLFVFVGLLPCGYFAGALGTEISSLIFGTSYGVLAGIVMVVGVLLSALVFTFGIGVVGWLGGMLLNTANSPLAARPSRSGNRRWLRRKSNNRGVAMQNA